MVTYRPSKQYKQLHSLKKQVIYKDDLFTFTTDDLYVLNDGDIYLFLDISRYFSLHISNLDNDLFDRDYRNYSDNSIFLKPKLINNNLLLIGFVSSGVVYKSYEKLPNIDDLIDGLSINYQVSTYLKLIPGNTMTDMHPPQSIFTKAVTIATINTNCHKLFEKRKVTDRKQKSSHHNMSVVKRFHEIIHNKNNRFNKQQDKNEYVLFLRKFQQHFARLYCTTYKEAKPFNTLLSTPVISNPLDNLMKLFFYILYRRTDNFSNTSISANNVFNDDTPFKKKYRLVRNIFVLISLGRFDDALTMLLNKTYRDLDRRLSIVKPDEYQNIQFKESPHRAIGRYKKKFDMLYQHFANYTYSCNSDKQMNLNQFIPNAHTILERTFKQYNQLYSITKDKDEFIYAFYRSFYDVRHLIEFVKVKPKF